MHDSPHSRAAARLEDVARPAHVHRLERRGRRGVAVERRHMADRVAIRKSPRQRPEIADVDPFAAHLVAGALECPHDVRAHESASGSGHVDPHRRH